MIGGVCPIDFSIAGFDMPGVEIEEGQRLTQEEEMLFSPGAGQSFAELAQRYTPPIWD